MKKADEYEISRFGEFVDKTNEFRLAIIAQNDAVILRNDSAVLRMKKANELYRLLVNYSNLNYLLIVSGYIHG